MVTRWKTFFSPYQELFFLGDPRLGLVIAIATSFSPRVALTGILAIVLQGELLRWSQIHHQILARTIKINALLIGFLVGKLCGFNWPFVLFFLMTQILTFALTIFIETYLSRLDLPALTIPFCLLSPFIKTFISNSNVFIDRSYYLNSIETLGFFSTYFNSFFYSISEILNADNSIIGLVIFLTISFLSPLSGIFLWFGYKSGIIIVTFLSHYLLWDTNNPSALAFNHSLLFIAITTFYRPPNLRTVLIGLFFICIDSMLLLFLQSRFHATLSLFSAVPFNATLFLYFAWNKKTKDPKTFVQVGTSPEEKAEMRALSSARFKWGERNISNPVPFAAKISQGVYGKHTHKGPLYFALDMIDSSDANHGPNKLNLEDWSTFGKPVHSPVSGTVVDLRHSIADNLIGRIDNINNWGNYIVIQSIDGFFVTLAHLKQNSVLVKIGDFVESNQSLGLIGNSGYSPFPHLHLQVQESLSLNSKTLPFNLCNYRIDDHIEFQGIPDEGQIIHPMSFNKATNSILNFIIGEKQTFLFTDPKHQTPIEVSIQNEMHPYDGRLYWTDGQSKVYYYKFGHQFYFYDFEGVQGTPVCDLYLAAPRIPMTFGGEYRFFDILPTAVYYPLWARQFIRFLQIIFTKYFTINGYYHLSDNGFALHGQIEILAGKKQLIETYFSINPQFGFDEFKVGSRHYVRKL